MNITENPNPGSILVVDDEAVIRKLLKLGLSPGPYTIYEAADTDQAAALLRDYPISLVLMDIRMPGKSGEVYLPEIIANYPDTAVIMCTAVNDASAAIECMKNGAYDYVVKPFNLGEVNISVQRALEKRRLILENRDYQNNLEQKVAAQALAIKESFLHAIEALAHALEAKDGYTIGHSQRVGGMAAIIAENMGLSKQTQEKIKLAGLIHDIGKIGVTELVLNKPGVLTPTEYTEVKQHCQIGEHILAPVVDDRELMQMVRSHHERFDGKGYPDGIRGNDIPIGASILSVCDAFDAMTSKRPYRAWMGTGAAFEEIERSRGLQFNPDVVDAFVLSREGMASVISNTTQPGFEVFK